MERKITIDGKEFNFKASAATPKRYRDKFHRDMLQDIAKLMIAFTKDENGEPDVDLEEFDMEILENIAYIMAKQGDYDRVPDKVEDWLDEFSGPLSLLIASGDIMDLWASGTETLVEPKKKVNQQTDQ